MEFLKNIQHRTPKIGQYRQDEFKNRRKRRSHRPAEAEVSFAPKSASLRRRLQFLHSPCRHGRAWILLVILLGAGSFAPQIRAQTFKEYDLKAAFLYHLAQFVDWPPEAFPTEETPLVIGILGTDPFGKVLDDIVDDEVVKNRKMAVQR